MNEKRDADLIINNLQVGQEPSSTEKSGAQSNRTSKATERKRADERAAWLASFPERNPNPLLELDPASGIVHYANPAAIQLAPDIKDLGMNHPLLAGLDNLEKALWTGTVATATREITVGERVFAQTITYIVETRRLRIYGSDITERKRSESAMARLAAIVESSDDAIIGKDLNGTITSWNGGAERLFGYSASEMVGSSIMALIPADRQEEEKQILGKIKRGEKVQHFETVRQAKDGRLIDVSVTVSPIKDSTGKIIGASKVARDITANKLTEKALRQSEARYQTIIENLTEGLAVSDLNGQLLHFNRAALDLHGFVSLDECRRHLAEFADTFELSGMDGKVWPVEQWPLARVLRGEKLHHLEAHIRRLQTDWQRVFSYGGTLVREAGGQPMMAVVTIMDITERKYAEGEIRSLNTKLEQRVAERTAQLQAANKELEAFSYSVSHDLRAPLRHVAGFVELLRADAEPVLSEKSNHHLATISKSAKRMGELIDDLLAFSRIGRSEMRHTNVNLDDLVKETLADLHGETKERNIRWKISPLPQARADCPMLRQALVNLLANAIKFTRGRNPATIEIGRAPSDEKEIVIFVRDNGAGFNPKYSDKLFGVFQRLHSSNDFEGTGIGLANVQRIIQRHGGRVWAEGAVDKGATFYFSIPNRLKEA